MPALDAVLHRPGHGGVYRQEDRTPVLPAAQQFLEFPEAGARPVQRLVRFGDEIAEFGIGGLRVLDSPRVVPDCGVHRSKPPEIDEPGGRGVG